MSSSSITPTKNIIFVTGNGIGKYKELAQEIAAILYKVVLLTQPNFAPFQYQSASEYAREKTLFFSQALFYGSLPSRRNIVLCIPELSMRIILQFMVLFEHIKKNVFVVVDDRFFITSLCKQKFEALVKRLPTGHAYFFSDFSKGDVSPSAGVEKLIDRLSFNACSACDISVRSFNGILSSIPSLFREEIKRSVFGTGFGDVPFNMLVKNLLPGFNDNEDEDEEGKKRLKMEGITRFPPRKTIPDYFMSIKGEQTKDKDINKVEFGEDDDDDYEDDNYDAETQPEDEYISLLEPFPDSDNPFVPKIIK